MGDMICREGIRNAAASLATCVNDGSNIEARTQLAFANTLGGYAMVCSGCCGCHGTEHAMSAHHHDLPHGAGLIMIAVAYHRHMIDAHACDERYVEMARLMGNEGASEPADFIAELERLMGECHVDGLKMSDWGIAEGELDAMAANGLATNGALYAHDPVPLSHDDVLAILRASYR
jgi:alcohol dehydrogenase